MPFAVWSLLSEVCSAKCAAYNVSILQCEVYSVQCGVRSFVSAMLQDQLVNNQFVMKGCNVMYCNEVM